MRELSWGLAKKILAQPCILSSPGRSVHIPSRTTHRHLQQPVHSHQQADVLGRQAYSRQNKEHGDQPSAGNTGCTNAGQCGCEAVRTKKVRSKEEKVALPKPSLAGNFKL